MKRVSFLTAAMMSVMLIFTACEKNPVLNDQDESILPQSFKVDIPDAISREASTKKSATVDTLKGDMVYLHLVTFINIGEEAADIVQAIIESLQEYQINHEMSFTYTGDDGRTKQVVVVANTSYDDRQWEFGMTITDTETEDGDSAGANIALQLFWNRQPVEGVALLCPANLDREHYAYMEEAMFRIDYTGHPSRGYDAWMMVQAADLPMANPLVDPYSMHALKMFVGKKGDFVDVYGNSDHPNARFFTMQTGFNWAFVASGQDSTDIACAEVGLPPSDLDEPSRDVLLGTYSVYNVLMREIMQKWPMLDSSVVATYLQNIRPPAYFDKHGFLGGGEMPGPEWNALVDRIRVLAPYNPKEIHHLKLYFKVEAGAEMND